MICRQVRFRDESPQWLLISQVEHARLSGELAEKCLARFGAGDRALDDVRHELLQAIIHHDDGWAEWEETPQLDAARERPLTFMELPSAEALAVWNRSIEAAREHGELAGWAVAGHFSALLATVGQNADEPAARDWIRTMADKRSDWFAAWRKREPSLHTAELAGEALKWLQWFDILSLWPCSQYPVVGEIVHKTPEPFLNVDNWVLVREIKPHFDFDSRTSSGRVLFSPWPFSEPELCIQAAAHLVPAQRYATAEELMAAREPFMAKWVLAAG